VKSGIRKKQDMKKADILNNALPLKKKPRQKLPLKNFELLGFHSFKGWMN
jgi:hypothetical protein